MHIFTMGKPRYRVAATLALVNAVTVGFCSTYSATATESMKSSALDPSDTEISWIGSTLPLGAVFGGIIAGYLSDKIGRKGVMMHVSVFLLLGWLLIAYAPSLPFIYAGRFITGICCGIICVVIPMYVVEVVTVEDRGSYGCRFQLFICIGIVIISVVGKFLPWNWVAIMASSVAVLAPFCVIFCPESPCWLLKYGKYPEATNALQFLYGNNEEISSKFIYQNFDESKNKASINITHPTVYKPALLSVALMFFQQFSGSNAVLYYTVLIFKEAKSSVEPATSNYIVAFIMYSFTFLSCYLMDKLGRKISLIISGLLTCISLNILSIYSYICHHNPTVKDTFGYIPLASLIVYIATFSIGLGPIPWLMMSEMSPTHARSFICGLGTAMSWIFTFIITRTFLDIEHLIYDYGAYWFYSFFCLLCCAFTVLLPETKGKSFEEIREFFCKNESHLQNLPSVADEVQSNLGNIQEIDNRIIII